MVKGAPFLNALGNHISVKNKTLHLSISQSPPLSPHEEYPEMLRHHRTAVTRGLRSLLGSGAFFLGRSPPPSRSSTSCPEQHRPREERKELGLSPRNGSRTRCPRTAADTGKASHRLPPPACSGPAAPTSVPPGKSAGKFLWAWPQLPIRSDPDTPLLLVLKSI